LGPPKVVPLRAGARFQYKRALAGGGNEYGRIQRRADLLRSSQPDQAGGGEDDRVGFTASKLVEPGIHISSQLEDLEIRSNGQQLCSPARRRRADPRSRGKVVDRSRA